MLFNTILQRFIPVEIHLSNKLAAKITIKLMKTQQNREI